MNKQVVFREKPDGRFSYVYTGETSEEEAKTLAKTVEAVGAEPIVGSYIAIDVGVQGHEVSVSADEITMLQHAGFKIQYANQAPNHIVRGPSDTATSVEVFANKDQDRDPSLY